MNEQRQVDETRIVELTELEVSSSDSHIKYCEEMKGVRESHAKAMEEMQQSYSNNLEKEDEARKAMALQHQEAIEKLQQEMNEQRQVDETRIIELREPHEKATQELKEQLERQEATKLEYTENIAKYENQIESLEQERETALQALKAQLTAQHEAETLLLKSESIEWQGGATTQIDELQVEMRKLLEKLCVTQKEASDETAASKDRMESKEKEHLAQIEDLKRNFDVERTDLTRCEQAARSEANDFSGQVKLLDEEMQTLENLTQELETTKRESEDKFNAEREALKSSEKEIVAKHMQELLKLKAELEQELATERQSMETKLSEALANQESQSDREKELTQKLSKLEEASKKDSENFDIRVKEVRIEHAAQIDEMLSQLDLVEAEHNQRYDTIEKSVTQKDAIISALGSQLAETQHRKTELKSEYEATTKILEATKDDLQFSRKAATELEESLEELRIEHKNSVETEKKKSQALCDQVRNETIAAAEEQFSKANGHYMTLKNEYNIAVTKIEKLEKELRSIRRDVESAKSEGVSREAAVAAELAQSKAGKCHTTAIPNDDKTCH